MRHIGFMGGSSLVELGTASEMIDFLDFFNKKWKVMKTMRYQADFIINI